MKKVIDQKSFGRYLRRQQTNVEEILWTRLRSRRLENIKFRRQHSIGPYIVDFFSYEKRIIIELDGGQHNTGKGKRRDQARRSWLESQGYVVIRFWNNEIIKDLDECLAIIQGALTQPSPLGRGE